MEEYLIKICGIGTNCNTNYGKKHIRYLVDLLSDKFCGERKIQPELLELISGLTFSVTGNFEATLDDDADIVDDIKKTQENLDRLEDYLGR